MKGAGILGALICVACSSSDAGKEKVLVCSASGSASVLANVHRLTTYPNDKFGRQATEAQGAIKISGQQDDPQVGSSVFVSFDPCLDARQYAGVSFEISGNSLPSLSRLGLTAAAVADEGIELGGSCQQTSDGSSCLPPDVTVDLSGTSIGVHYRWADFSNGRPDPSVFDAQFKYLGWAFESTQPVPLDITIDQLEFF